MKISFRFWDKEQNSYVNELKFSYKDGEFDFGDNIIVERATEFFDKEGTRIFEGDILADSFADGKETYYVVWAQDGFVIKSFEHKYVCDLLSDFAMPNNSENESNIIDSSLIIGNVKENGEIFNNENFS